MWFSSIFDIGGTNMKKLDIQDCDIMQVAIQQEIIRSEESRYDNKLHGVLLACSGMTCEEIAGVLGRGVRTIQYWIRRFNNDGFAGLREQEGRGRPNRLCAKDVNGIGEDLRRSPLDFGFEQTMWDGKLLMHHIRKRYGKILGVRQCQRLFHKLGFRLRKPRPLIAKADPAIQAAYKKTETVERG
jgi:transposase